MLTNCILYGFNFKIQLCMHMYGEYESEEERLSEAARRGGVGETK